MKKGKDRMPQHKGLREKLYAAVGILLIVVLLISIWQLGGYLIDVWKSKTFIYAVCWTVRMQGMWSWGSWWRNKIYF